ncbi:hypothetical protein M758_2G143900 [Ceratodon purpureus]|nr:hypothetical protein M758_2G143900 [Ceratodon purpureus]
MYIVSVLYFALMLDLIWGCLALGLHDSIARVAASSAPGTVELLTPGFVPREPLGHSWVHWTCFVV